MDITHLPVLETLNCSCPVFVTIILLGFAFALKAKINLVLNLKMQLMHCYSPLTLGNIIMCMVLLVLLTEK